MRKFKDMTGQIFGRLTVIEKDEDKSKFKKVAYWFCECNCGSGIIKSYDGCALRSKKVESCGCIKKELSSASVVDLTGKKFGRLTVIKRDGKANDGHIKWLCKCECGGERTSMGRDLKNGSSQSCGCLQIERLIESHIKYNTYDLTGEYGVGYTFKGEPFYFDLEDYDKIKDHCWSINYGYVISRIKGEYIRMHRLITNCLPDMEVDHIFHLTYDNRKSQLRIVTGSQNMMNKRISKSNKSGVKGVHFHKQSSGWVATISVDWKQYYKFFKNKEDAIIHRKKMEKIYQGEYAFKEISIDKLNII